MTDPTNVYMFSIRRPADMHCHFRQDDVLQAVVPATAKLFGYAVAMPNTKPPITTIEQVEAYKAEIYRAGDHRMIPIGVLYLTDVTVPETVREGFMGGGAAGKSWMAAKLYPAGATTNSADGVTDIKNIYPVLEVMQEIGMPLLLHGEMLERDGSTLARWEREDAFLETSLPQLLGDFPRLKVVLEHVSTARAVEFVLADESGRLRATITPHHLLFTDADLSIGGVSVHANCMPVIKTAKDRTALRKAATSGDPRFFAGTDSAPHDVATKHCSCCSYGAFVAPGAVEAYAAVFEEEGVFEHIDNVERFERFMSINGPAFYGLTPALGSLTLSRNTDGRTIRERFRIPGTKLLDPGREIIPLFHEDTGVITAPFPWIVIKTSLS